ncbi:MAG TPA: YcgL domain-containing protein [Pseudomonadales bacterium]
MDSLICTVYRSSKKPGMYLYVDKKTDLQPVPPALLALFGAPQRVMTLLVKAERKLARVTGADVIRAIVDTGFYLQMEPAEDEDMQAIARLNDKLYGG